MCFSINRRSSLPPLFLKFSPVSQILPCFSNSLPSLTHSHLVSLSAAATHPVIQFWAMLLALHSTLVSHAVDKVSNQGSFETCELFLPCMKIWLQWSSILWPFSVFQPFPCSEWDWQMAKVDCLQSIFPMSQDVAIHLFHFIRRCNASDGFSLP